MRSNILKSEGASPIIHMGSLIREAWGAIFWRQKEHHSLEMGSLILETLGVIRLSKRSSIF
jgi:hypothetical protein